MEAEAAFRPVRSAVAELAEGEGAEARVRVMDVPYVD